MLMREILRESNLPDAISNDLMDIITTFRMKKVDEIPMDGPTGTVTMLKNLGYYVTASDVMKLLSGPEFADVVERSDPKIIKIKTGMPDSMVSKDEMEKSREKVQKTAAKVATKSIKAKDST